MASRGHKFGLHSVEEEVPYAYAFNLDATGSPLYTPQLILNADEEVAWLEELLVELNDTSGLGQDLRLLYDPAIVGDDALLRDQGIRTVLPGREMYGGSETHRTLDDTLDIVGLGNVRTVTQLLVLGVRSLAGE